MTPQQNAYLKIAIPAAQVSMQQTHVPASVTIAQGACESAWGAKAPGNNYFGIKASHNASPNSYVEIATHEYVHGVSVLEHDCFCKYDTPAESFVAHGRLISLAPRYSPAMRETGDVQKFCEELQACGYSTNPRYAQLLMQIIQEHDLTQYDHEPQPPAAQKEAA